MGEVGEVEVDSEGVGVGLVEARAVAPGVLLAVAVDRVEADPAVAGEAGSVEGVEDSAAGAGAVGPAVGPVIALR